MYQYQGTIQQLLRELQPDGIDELAATLALRRTGAVADGTATTYAARKHGRLTWAGPHPEVANILAETKGTVLYQEQVAEIVHRLAGLPSDAGLEIVAAISMERWNEVWSYRERFNAGARTRLIEAELADQVFNSIISRAPHTFCKANAMTSACLAYQAAYAKAHFPDEFKAARRLS